MEFRKPNLQVVPVTEGFADVNEASSPPNILVSKFEYSLENHFKMLDTIAMLYGESEFEYEEEDLQWLSSSITFLRAWRDFRYQPRAIRFAYETKTSEEKNVTAQMNLPQFSSAAVPKETSDVNKDSSPLRKDFVMCVGGHVWALDWCPKVHQNSDFGIKTEFIAIAAHPPESSYHKIGSPLSGRGLIQIWCLSNAGGKDEDVVPLSKVKPRKYSRQNEATKLDVNHNQPKRPRGRPRKNPLSESVGYMDSSDTHLQNVSVQFLENSNELVRASDISQVTLQVAKEEADKNSVTNKVQKPRGRPRKKPKTASLNSSACSKTYPDILPAEFLKASSLTDKVFMETREQVPKEDNHRNQNTHEEWASTGEHIISGGSETINYKPTKQGKPKARKRTGKSIDNLDGSDPNIHGECASTGEHIISGGSETINYNPTKRGKPKARKRTGKSIDKLVSSDPNQQPLAVELSEHAPNLLAVDRIQAGIFPEHQCHNPDGCDAEIIKSSEPLKRREKPTEYAVDNSNCSNQHVQALDVHITSDLSKFVPGNGCSSKTNEQVTKRDLNLNVKDYDKQLSTRSVWTSSKSRITKCQTRIESQVNGAELCNLSQNFRNSFQQDPLESMDNISNPVSFDIVSNSGSISDNIALPKLVMGLAHNGRVAWDVKWRPSDSHAISKHIMGYLAVLLGNGALEVWKVPHPHATKAVFSSCQKEGIDPRFLKLKPVFMCSVLKCGDRQSIPLTLEWSSSAPNDLILAGCHDGVVALWKFIANGPSKDTRPLLCFSADTGPIRALKWAPATSDPESANIYATAGHKGVKFWDIRDPVRPLWNIPSQKIIYSLDWLLDPRCAVVSYDDGEIMIYSLSKAACDVAVTGMPTIKTELHGSHRYNCSSSSIWSVQASRTGMVAYCCSDGTVIHFQLTTKAVEKDASRYREPHYLCGSLAVEESIITVFSPLPNVPLPMKKLSNQETRAKEKISKRQTPEEHSSEGRLVIAQKSHTSKTKKSSKENPKAKTSQALICVDNVVENEDENVGNEEVEVEVIPPKMVAMHRVRWNMNKGSERWLCYGGAAGIVRCQEVNFSRT